MLTVPRTPLAPLLSRINGVRTASVEVRERCPTSGLPLGGGWPSIDGCDPQLNTF